MTPISRDDVNRGWRLRGSRGQATGERRGVRYRGRVATRRRRQAHPEPEQVCTSSQNIDSTGLLMETSVLGSPLMGFVDDSMSDWSQVYELRPTEVQGSEQCANPLTLTSVAGVASLGVLAGAPERGRGTSLCNIVNTSYARDSRLLPFTSRVSDQLPHQSLHFHNSRDFEPPSVGFILAVQSTKLPLRTVPRFNGEEWR
jgi:hypothetical protein